HPCTVLQELRPAAPTNPGGQETHVHKEPLSLPFFGFPVGPGGKSLCNFSFPNMWAKKGAFRDGRERRHGRRKDLLSHATNKAARRGPPFSPQLGPTD